MKVINPFSGKVVSELPMTTDAQLDQALYDARAAYEDWRRLPLARRMEQVRAGLSYFEANREAIAKDITLQMGKPITEARGEVDAMCGRAEHMLAIAEKSLAPDLLRGTERPGFTLRIQHEPLGIVLNLAAWNYPLLIAVNVVVPALLAGNVVLLKHSAKTPLCGQHFEKAFPHVKNLLLDHEQTADFIREGLIDHVAFTGSVEGGRQIFQHVASARYFMDTGLELGGKDPAYVAYDADLDFVVPNIVEGACYNAGQSCCAIERVYVHQDLYDEFLERAKDQLAQYVLGDPLEESTTMGPLASKSALDHLDAQVLDAVSRGAKLLCGGERCGDQKQFFPPTLLAGCDNGLRVMQEESFGPLLPVLSVQGDDEALQRMNHSEFGLTASIWTRDRRRAEAFAEVVEAGTIFQNRCDYLDPCLAWTGVKDSGKGSTLSRYGFLHLTRRKSIHFRN